MIKLALVPVMAIMMALSVASPAHAEKTVTVQAAWMLASEVRVDPETGGMQVYEHAPIEVDYATCDSAQPGNAAELMQAELRTKEAAAFLDAGYTDHNPTSIVRCWRQQWEIEVQPRLSVKSGICTITLAQDGTIDWPATVDTCTEQQ